MWYVIAHGLLCLELMYGGGVNRGVGIFLVRIGSAAVEFVFSKSWPRRWGR